MFNLDAVFVAWCRKIKPKGKRKWTIEKFWDRREFTMVTEPVLPKIIRSEVLTEVMKYVKVHILDEWKAIGLSLTFSGLAKLPNTKIH